MSQTNFTQYTSTSTSMMKLDFFSLKDFIKMLDHNNSTIFCAFVCMHKLLTDLLNPLQEVTAINCFKF